MSKMLSAGQSQKLQPAVLEKLQQILKEVAQLRHLSSLAHWDLEINLPSEAVGQRSEVLAMLQSKIHQQMTSEEFGNLLEVLKDAPQQEALSSVEKILVREVTQDYQKSKKIPTSLVEALSRTTSEAHGVWVEARKAQDYQKFQAVFGKIVDLNKKMADYLGWELSPYNALLDQYEEGLTVQQLDELFQRLKPSLIPLVQTLAKQPQPKTSGLNKRYPIEKQLTFSHEILAAMGFDLNRGRLDKSVHPFTSDIGGPQDVRLTTRASEDNPMECILAVMHEAGHGLYEQGLDPDLPYPLCSAVSLGIHESQSRLWENQIGLSQPFWRHFYPKFQALFPENVGKISLTDFLKELNYVKPGFIRIEADEVTYNLHIIIRYEIERALIEESISVADVPGLWNQKMQAYLGITPPNDAVGCLQDIHWAYGNIGYFPTYTLGNCYAAQFYHTAQEQLSHLPDSIAKGQLNVLKQWLNENIHRFGRLKPAQQLCQEVTGEPLNPAYFLKYLNQKYSALYQIDLASPSG